MGNRVLNSSIDESARIYERVRIANSQISSGCVVGDDCDLVDVVMSEYAEFARRNLIRKTRIGIGSYTGTNTIVKNAVIGNYCSIAWNVSIGGGNHAMSSASTYTPYWWKRTFDIELDDSREAANCEIGSDVWIGAGANIVTGVRVGDGAVLGAGAVVVKDIPSFAVVGGVPARIIRYRFDEKTRKRLLKLAWWDWPRSRVALAATLLHERLDEQTLEKLEALCL